MNSFLVEVMGGLPDTGGPFTGIRVLRFCCGFSCAFWTHMRAISGLITLHVERNVSLQLEGSRDRTSHTHSVLGILDQPHLQVAKGNSKFKGD